jgi:glycosyltransferase involved in cell wall biosynthesis
MPEPKTESQLRIAYLTVNDPHDQRSWSGTEYAMARALEKHCGALAYVGPLKKLSRKIHWKLSVALKKLSGRSFLFGQTLSFSRRLGKLATNRIRNTNCNVIFAPAQSSTLAHLETNLPIVYLSDATVRLVQNYYDEFSNVIPSHRKTAEQLESLAIRKAARLVYPSSWAAKSAIEDYGADPKKVSVIPFGASLDTSREREAVIRVPSTDRCRLLFVGREWERKGGEIALEAFRELKRMGLPTELSIVGCEPPTRIVEENLQVFPFLNKNIPEQRRKLQDLYANAHFFILPTRAECFSIALCEANAAGLPVLTTRTGGLPDLVKEGVNGFLFPLEAQGECYAEVVRQNFSDLNKYKNLRESSRNEFETRLNWDHWGTKVREVLLSAVSGEPTRIRDSDQLTGSAATRRNDG